MTYCELLTLHYQRKISKNKSVLQQELQPKVESLVNICFRFFYALVIILAGGHTFLRTLA